MPAYRTTLSAPPMLGGSDLKGWLAGVDVDVSLPLMVSVAVIAFNAVSFRPRMGPTVTSFDWLSYP